MSSSTAASKSSNSKLDAPVVKQAFEALKTYEPGSSRAGLLPLDQAVIDLQVDPARKQLEQQFIAALKTCKAAVAREYICTKLALIGSEVSVPALAALLGEGELATAARNALEQIPGREPAKALRGSLSKLAGLPKVGVINSLGARRDGDSVRLLSSLLKDADLQVASAAAAALGNIGSPKAAKALQTLQAKAPGAIRHKAAEAALICAEHLLAEGHKAGAQSLYQTLTDPALPAHIRNAASRGLKACGSV